MTTNGPSTSLTGPSLRTLHRDLAAAQDDQIHRVLTIIDALAERGDADKLIAPLRGRIAELRPRRKLSLTRLLFTPLHPLIVDAAGWSSAAPSIPRTAILPLAGQVRDGLGATAATLDALAAQHSSTDGIGELVGIGGELWPAAAKVLAGAPMPANWTAKTGLRERDHAALASAVSSLLAQAFPLLRVVVRAMAGTAPEPEELHALLEAVVPAGGQSLAMMIGLALGWLPRSELLIRVVDDFAGRHADPAVSATVDGAIDFVLTRIEQSPLPSADLTTAAVEARQVAVMLGDLMLGSAQRPRRRNRVEQVRREVDTACRERFTIEVETQLVTPSAGIAAAGDDAIEALEAAARGLRRFEGAARQIGSAEQYDQQLKRAAEALRPKPDEDAVARVSRVRLVEILRGSDVAVAMLK
ncbi:MAG: hypothetical protein WA864_10495 [Acetobacteraceae bacterium]